MKSNPVLLTFLFILSLVFCSCTKDEPVSPKEKETEYYSITGKVAKTNDTSDYFSGVVVSVNQIIDTTDENGIYVLKNIPSGKVNISFSHPDYDQENKSVQLTGNLQIKTLMQKIRPDYFPNETGNFWKYEVYDIMEKRSYILAVTVLKSTVYDSIEMKVWKYEYLSGTFPPEEVYFYVKEGDFYKYGVGVEFKHPLKTGLVWYNNWNESKVVGQEDVVTKAGSFNGSYKIESFFDNGGNDWGKTTKWFVPGVGLVKKNLWSKGFGGVNNETWTLVEYRVL